MERELLLDILSIVIPVLIAAGAGGAALWRQMQMEERHQREREAAAVKGKNDYQLKADKAAFDRATETIDRLDKRLKELEAKAKECFETLERVERENHTLVQEVKRLRGVAGG